MTAKPRVLGCAINRSTVSSPSFDQHQTKPLHKIKSNISIKPQVPRTLPEEPVFDDVSTSSTVMTDNTMRFEKEQIPSIFRSRSLLDHESDGEEEDMWMLKRANPVYEPEDESPTKRMRRSAAFDCEHDAESRRSDTSTPTLLWSEDSLMPQGETGMIELPSWRHS
eukprot:CAMPEP_0194044764 /NCGR_PEP_ID=MMETSP0009_2-20130614/16176_1 /TAXON_ID=210454 /ORGANISM="Grammatophora oceanica, Strain CCMP 410" /LENGTH=165 /DNA_ID=CAMNT_0038689375 /DNA_START=393 /DNA_END=890 /DNA_ORIENTATION=+